jgi:hypothetical protein
MCVIATISNHISYLLTMIFQLALRFPKESESLPSILPPGSLSTSTLHFVTSPVITPKAASHGAKTIVVIAPAAPQVTGMDSKILPLSSLTMIRLPSRLTHLRVYHRLLFLFLSRLHS